MEPSVRARKLHPILVITPVTTKETVQSLNVFLLQGAT